MSAQSRSIPSLSCSCVYLRKSVPPLAPSPPCPIHHHPSHLHLVCSLLLSTCFHFLNCSRSIKFTLPSMTIFHFLFHSLLLHAAWVYLAPVLSALLLVLYFTQLLWPQVGIAVLVTAVASAEAAGYSVLQGLTCRNNQVSLFSKLKFHPRRLWIKVQKNRRTIRRKNNDMIL